MADNSDDDESSKANWSAIALRNPPPHVPDYQLVQCFKNFLILQVSTPLIRLVKAGKCVESDFTRGVFGDEEDEIVVTNIAKILHLFKMSKQGCTFSKESNDDVDLFALLRVRNSRGRKASDDTASRLGLMARLADGLPRRTGQQVSQRTLAILGILIKKTNEFTPHDDRAIVRHVTHAMIHR